MLTLAEKILFLGAVGLSLFYGWRGFSKVYRVILRGSGARPAAGELLARLGQAGATWLGTRPIWKARPWSSFFHALVSVGFVFYFLVNFVDLVEGFFPVILFEGSWAGNFYRLLADLATASVLVGVLYFSARRFLFDDRALQYNAAVKLVDPVQAGAIRRDSGIVLLFVWGHVGFRLVGNSFKVALYGADPWQPFSTLLAQAWLGWDREALTVGEHLGWWLAFGLILVFVPYFPYTKHLHLIFAGVNFLTKPQRTSPGALDPIDFEDESQETFGVRKIEELPWTQLIDAYACIMCNRCQEVCPAYTTGKELSPAALEVNKRYFLNTHLTELAAGEPSAFNLLDFAISEAAVWACTACGACVEICPVGNEPMFDILYLRRHEMLMENRFPAALKTAYRGMERSGNPWNLSERDRLSWAKGLAVPTVDENPEFDLLWWVGCAPAYDPRAQESARALAQVLAAAGVNFAVLGERERCTGDAARRSGNEALFYELAQNNIATLDEALGGRPRRIVTTCPHCLHTLAKEYPQYGGRYNVIHHTQLLSELTAAKKISVARTQEGERITFHDPCYLGRQNGIVDEPRTLLQQSHALLVEMPRHGSQSFCCGAGGAQIWKEEEAGSAAVNQTRYAEAAATGAQTIAVGCPFCLTMLSDAARQAGQGIQVKEITELLQGGAAERTAPGGAGGSTPRRG
jgi:Fe-S oxidoreductase